MIRCLILVSVVASLVACGKSDAKKQSPSSAQPSPSSVKPVAKAPAPVRTEKPDLDPTSIAWTEHTIEELGISVPTIDGVDVRANTMDSSTYVQQIKAPIRASFWMGEGRTIEKWRTKYADKSRFKMTDPEVVEICGVKGTKQTLAIPQGRMQVGFATAEELPPDVAGAEANPPAQGPTTHAPGGANPHWKKNPATTTTVIGFERKGVPVIVSWTVETAKREAFQSAEDAYFAGIICTD